jgi:hypothetical protein
VLGLLIDKLATLRVDLWPGFFTADDMHPEAFAVPLIAIGDVVGPPEPLLALALMLIVAVLRLARLERLDLLSNRRQALIGQDTHKLPAVLPA